MNKDLSEPPANNVWWSCVAKGILILSEGQTAHKAFMNNAKLFQGLLFSDCKDWNIITEIRGKFYD